MELSHPQKQYFESWRRATEAFDREGLQGVWKAHPEAMENFTTYQHYLESRAWGSSRLGYDMYWVVEQGNVIGYVKLKPFLTVDRYKRGGHISYALIPAARGKGYGKELLRLALELMKKRGVQEVLLLVDETNIPSQKIIEHNGGRHTDSFRREGVLVRRYWITLRT